MRLFVTILTALASIATARADWREAETTHFRIMSGGDEKALVRFAERLEAFHYMLRLASGVDDTGMPLVKVRVYLVDTVDTVQRLIGRPGSDVAGFYNPTENGSLAVVPRDAGSDGSFSGQVVLFHEYAHHFTLQYLPGAYPLWYVEGSAEIASTASFERKGFITYGKAASHRQAELIYGDRYPIAKMIDGSYLTVKPGQPSWSYGQAWLLTHFLTFSPERRGQLRAYLNAINAGQPYPEAAKVFGDLNRLQRDVSVYFESGSVPYRAVPIPDGVIGATKVRVLSAGEADLINEVVEMERRTGLPSKPGAADDGDGGGAGKGKVVPYEQRLAEAKAERESWLAALTAKVNRHADDHFAWRVLADAQCSSDHYALCETAADRAMALDAGDSRAQLRKAEAMLETIDGLESAARTKRVNAAIRLISKANAADVDDPLPLLAYYRSFGLEGKVATSDAIEGLKRVVLTAPQLSGPRLSLARELISRHDVALARAVLKPLAYSPHKSPGSASALALLASLEAPTPASDGKDVKATAPK